MPFERWGSLSVDDHVDPHLLVANVLLYDRLVIPVMAPQPDRDELAYWKQQGWNPELQKLRVDQLDDLAIARPWTAGFRKRFHSRLAELAAEKQDVSAKHVTRMILAEDATHEKPDGVTIVAAYNSRNAMSADFCLEETVEDTVDPLAAQAVLLERRLAIPALEDPDDSLKAAIELSRDGSFREKRRQLFDWQDLAAARRWSIEDTVERIVDMTDQYNAEVKRAAKMVRWKFAFTIFGIGLGFATGGLTIGVGAAASLALVQFAFFDRVPAIAAGSAAPAAMFHDIETKLGLTLL